MIKYEETLKLCRIGDNLISPMQLLVVSQQINIVKYIPLHLNMNNKKLKLNKIQLYIQR